MSEARKVSITVDESGNGEILLDGKPVVNCNGFDLHAGAGEVTTLTLRLINISVSASAKIYGHEPGDVANENSPQCK